MRDTPARTGSPRREECRTHWEAMQQEIALPWCWVTYEAVEYPATLSGPGLAYSGGAGVWKLMGIQGYERSQGSEGTLNEDITTNSSSGSAPPRKAYML